METVGNGWHALEIESSQQHKAIGSHLVNKKLVLLASVCGYTILLRVKEEGDIQIC